MKAVNKICRILAIVLGLGSVVLFFTEFANVVMTDGKEVSIVGAQLSFGGNLEFEKVKYDMAKSAHVWLAFWITVLGAVFAGLSFKTKKLRYAAPAFGLVAAIYMFVIALSADGRFFDIRPLPNVTKIVNTPFVLITAIALAVFTVVALAHLLIDDYLEVKASKGDKLTILKRIGRFFRDYKSEIKKIVWPGWKEVAKNTVIVLIMCLIIGALIWAVDFGLGELLKLILGA